MKITLGAAALALAFGFAVPGAQSQTLEEFRRAEAEQKNCDSIPYESLRRSCAATSQDVYDYCKSNDDGCGDLNVYAKDQERNKANRDLQDLERKRSDLKSKRDSASTEDDKKKFQVEVDTAEKDIDAKKRDIDTLSKTIDDYKYSATGRIEKNKRCLAVRKKAIDIFDEAMGKVTDAKDPDSKAIAYRLVARWNAEEAGHKTQMDNVQNRLNKCEKAARGDSFN